MTLTVNLAFRDCISYWGEYRDVVYEIKRRGFNPDWQVSGYRYAEIWNTYVLISEEMHDKFKDRINSAPWNYGQTYYRKITEDHVDVSPELREKWSKPYYKIGDDYQHVYDRREFGAYSVEEMRQSIFKVIDYLIDGDSED